MILLIVDDEMHIRMGLKNGIQWHTHDIDTVLVAENGIEALDLCHRYHPELVITDIRMPGMDGLVLSQNIVNLYRPVKILILTGYSEFEYVKTALKVGVVDYLLKPVNIQELEDIITLSVQDIYKSLENQRTVAKLDSLTHAISLETVFESENPNSDLICNIIMDHLNITNKQLFIIGAYSIDSVYTTDMYQLSLYIEKEILSADCIVKQYKLYHKNGTIYTLIPVFSENDWERKSKLLNNSILITNRLLKNQFQNSLSFCASSINCISQVLSLWQEVNYALSCRLYLGKKIILTKSPVHTADSHINLNLIDSSYITEKIRIFDYESIHIYLKERFNTYKKIQLSNTEIVRTTCTTLKQLLITTLLSKGIDVTAILELNKDLLNKIPEYNTLDEYEQWINDLYFLILSGLHNTGDKKHSRIIRQAVDYIYQNYNQNISLEKVADHVNKSKNYFSYLFKKEVGVSYIDYLNQVRIEKAKTLLLSTDKLTYEIAEHVGYSDYKYFSSMFKKYAGTSPSQFRKME